MALLAFAPRPRQARRTLHDLPSATLIGWLREDLATLVDGAPGARRLAEDRADRCLAALATRLAVAEAS